MTREFSIVREMSRREVERHAKRFIGVTVTEPAFREQDDNGLTEWVCDIRVGIREGWAVVKNCLIAQWALGIVTDMNIPVVAERSEAGRVTIIARSEVSLPDIILDSYEYEELGFSFMRNLDLLADGSLIDGYGFELAPPGSVVVEDIKPEEEDDIEQPIDKAKPFGVGPKNRNPRLTNLLIEWGSTDFDYGVTPMGARVLIWQG